MTVAYDEILEQIAQSVFSTMLGTELFRAETAEYEFVPAITASVHIVGEWTGCVVISLSQESAKAAAAQFLAIASESVTSEDEVDAVAEITNMIGGNLKSVLPGPSHLSIPSVFNGDAVGIRMDSVIEIESLYLASEFGVMRVRLFEKKSFG